MRKTQTMSNFARVLYELQVPEEAVDPTRQIIGQTTELTEVLCNPLVQAAEKYRVIDRVFPAEITKFLKVVCKHQRFEMIEGILEAYEDLIKEKKRIVSAVLMVVDPPSDQQLEGIKAFLCREYEAEEAEIEIQREAALLGGFVLRVGSFEYDWSLRGRLDRLEQKMTRR